MTPHIKETRTRIAHAPNRRAIACAAILGSFACGNAEEGSDPNILVKFGGEKVCPGVVGLKLELGDSLGRSVDELTCNALHPADMVEGMV